MHNQARLPVLFACLGAKIHRKLRQQNAQNYTGHHQLKWQCVKTLYPCSSHQNSWDLWMFIPLKMVLIGIDPYPNAQESSESWDIHG